MILVNMAKDGQISSVITNTYMNDSNALLTNKYTNIEIKAFQTMQEITKPKFQDNYQTPTFQYVRGFSMLAGIFNL